MRGKRWRSKVEFRIRTQATIAKQDGSNTISDGSLSATSDPIRRLVCPHTCTYAECMQNAILLKAVLGISRKNRLVCRRQFWQNSVQKRAPFSDPFFKPTDQQRFYELPSIHRITNTRWACFDRTTNIRKLDDAQWWEAINNLVIQYHIFSWCEDRLLECEQTCKD